MTTIKENNPYIYIKYYLSYWILIWAGIYIVIDWGFKKQHLQTVVPMFARSYIQLFLQNCNPTIALLVAVVVNVYLIVSLFYRIIIKEPSLNERGVGAGAEERNKIAMLFLYFIVIVIKIIPIYFLRNAPFKIVNNTIIFLLVILVYYYYLATNGINMYNFYRNINEKAFDGITPFVHQMFQLIK